MRERDLEEGSCSFKDGRDPLGSAATLLLSSFRSAVGSNSTPYRPAWQQPQHKASIIGCSSVMVENAAHLAKM